MAFNDWQTQPRDPKTGRWKNRGGEHSPRSEILCFRLTVEEKQMIEEAASFAGQTMTNWLIDLARAYGERQRVKGGGPDQEQSAAVVACDDVP